jgi:hypothetical protein
MVGALVTVRLTAIFWGLLLAPGAVIVIVPLYVPGFNPVGFTDTLKLAAVVPLAGVAESQLPPVVVAENATGELAETVRVWGGGSVPALWYV